jgi:hypothetical protein
MKCTSAALSRGLKTTAPLTLAELAIGPILFAPSGTRAAGCTATIAKEPRAAEADTNEETAKNPAAAINQHEPLSRGRLGGASPPRRLPPTIRYRPLTVELTLARV